MRSRIVWTGAAWSDYIYWQKQDKKIFKRINILIKDSLRNPEDGIGKPEALRESLSRFWSRRVDDVHHLLYAIEKDHIVIIACRYHYEGYSKDMLFTYQACLAERLLAHLHLLCLVIYLISFPRQ